MFVCWYIVSSSGDALVKEQALSDIKALLG